MSYYTIGIDFGDIQFDGNGNLIMTTTLTEGIAQSYKILLETQYESDFRESDYGFKLQEFLQSDFDNTEDLLRLYVTEALIQHELTEQILEIEIARIGDRSYQIDCRVQIKGQDEIIEFTTEV